MLADWATPDPGSEILVQFSFDGFCEGGDQAVYRDECMPRLDHTPTSGTYSHNIQTVDKKNRKTHLDAANWRNNGIEDSFLQTHRMEANKYVSLK